MIFGGHGFRAALGTHWLGQFQLSRPGVPNGGKQTNLLQLHVHILEVITDVSKPGPCLRVNFIGHCVLFVWTSPVVAGGLMLRSLTTVVWIWNGKIDFGTVLELVLEL